jgi:tetratricopeptide (TPR) repeat protein
LAALARTQGDRARAEAYEKIVATLPGDTLWPDPFLDELMQLQVGQRGFDRRVRHFEQERHYDEAAQLYLARLKNYPTAANYLGAGMNIGRVARARTRPEDRAADYDRAFELLREAVRLGPDSSSAQYALALVVFARAERDWQTTPGAPHLSAWFREARDHAERACDLRTDYAEALLIWGMSLKYLGQPAAALAPLRRGVAAQPASRELQLGLGLALLEAGQGAEAETYLENARRLAPSDPRPVQALERLRKQRTPLKK